MYTVPKEIQGFNSTWGEKLSALFQERNTNWYRSALRKKSGEMTAFVLKLFLGFSYFTNYCILKRQVPANVCDSVQQCDAAYGKQAH